MGSKVSIRTNRLSNQQFADICQAINREQFIDYYLNNGNEEVCQHYNINLNTMYRLIKYFDLHFSKEQLITRNKIATEQRVKALYGVNNNFERKEVQNLIKINNKLKYGVENQFQRQEIKEKIKQTNIEKYGAEYYTQTVEYHKKAQTKYLYDNEYFDSFPELATWIYAKDHNWKIVREPIKLEYSYNNEEHYYFPDFSINDELVEIKGIHFFEDKDINKKMINPFDSTRNDLAEAKHQCMINNNVKILTEIDYIKYIEYVYENYNINAFITINKYK